MRYRILLLSLAMLAACAGDPGGPPAEQRPEEEHPPQPRAARVDEMRVVKIAGDQSAQVPPPAAGALSADRTAVVGTDGWTDVPLIARIEIVPPTSGSAAALSVSAAESLFVPPGTLVHWRIDPDCGELFASTTATDDSAYTANRWRPGTRAGTCTAEAGRLVGTDIVIDTTWTLEVLPGPPALLLWAWGALENRTFDVGDSINIGALINNVYDAYDNPVPRDSILAWPDSLVTWYWTTDVCAATCRPVDILAEGSGWRTTVPGPHPLWEVHYQGKYQVFLHVELPVETFPSTGAGLRFNVHSPPGPRHL